MKIDVDVDVDNIVSAIRRCGREEAHEAIRQIDLSFADCDFTEDVIKSLFEELVEESFESREALINRLFREEQ